jgi:glutamine synthetase
MKNAVNLTELIDKIKAGSVTKVKIAITDLDGVLCGKYMHAQKFLSALEKGFGFCDVIFGWDAGNVCYESSERTPFKFTGLQTGYPDTSAVIDPLTFREIPWEDNQPFFLADFKNQQGDPLAICPRQKLKQIIQRAEAAKLKPYYAFEFEFFCFKETPESLVTKEFRNLTPLSPGMFGYSVTRASLNRPFYTALLDQLDAFRVPVEGLHEETGPGVMEAAILYSDALEAADRAVLFKTGAKEIAYKHGIIPTFMAKFNEKLPGSSGHIHQSIWDQSGEKNLFYQADRPNAMSPLFESFVAGQLALLPEFLPFFAPTVNSYKRLVEGMWAPTRVTWGIDNRTVALRVIPGGTSSTRLETRVSGADVNPYLAAAAALASGLYGIERNLKLDVNPTLGNAYISNAARLPRTLLDAAQKLSTSSVARDFFGDQFVDHYVNSRIWEWDQHQRCVHDWELKRYLEVI